MKKIAALSLVMLILVAPMGCFGPNKATYGWQGIMDQFYAENDPWIGGNVIAWAVHGIVSSVTYFADGFINAYYFWIEDAFPIGDGKSTPAVHKNPTAPGR